MNNRKVFIPAVAIIAVIIAVIIFFIVRDDYNSQKYNGELYFFNDSATAIEAESREIKYKDNQDLAEEIIKALMKGPESGRHLRIIERNADLLSVSGVDTRSALVNFSGNFITGDSTKDILAVYAVVKSLCATDIIDSVKVVIEGKDLSTSDGSIIGYLSNQDINLPGDTYTSENREVTLYFPERGLGKLQREVRNIKVTDQQPIAQYIINELIKGSNNEELTSALSKDTVLLSVETSDNICFVNFKSSFLDKNSGAADKEKMVIFSIVDSLTELYNIERVQFLMDGKKVDMFGNINIGSMFGRDESLIAN
ncbi:MAG: GerMN domain-containing protein [Oscillospiraceae bacterium]|nr:GerMN domain-containing protein [Oscillospiraceae bacterium]